MDIVTGVVVPYTDGMHLGQGFNSYTLEPCLYDCVGGSQVRSDNRSTSYMAMIVSKPSDVARALNIPFYPSMKRGSLSFNDAISPVDEAEFMSADVRFLVIVNVETQRVSISAGAEELRVRNGIQPGTLLFHETYGDSYVSQYIAGGTTAVVLSVTVLDRSKVEETIEAIKGSLDLTDHEASVKVILNAYGTDNSNAFATALRGTKTHACASCIGNGNLKRELANKVHGIDKVLANVSNFPNTVSDTSAWTWAVLTRYHLSSSLIGFSGSSEYATLRYDQVEGLSTELFDNFMGFKELLRGLEAIIVDHDNLEACKSNEDQIEVSLEALLGVRYQLRQEQIRIIEAIEVLSRDPWSPKRQIAGKQWQRPQPATDFAVVARQPAAGPNAVDPIQEAYTRSTVIGGAVRLPFDFDNLAAPDIWKRSMPTSKITGAAAANHTSRVAQSSEAMDREHKEEIDVLLGTSSSEVQVLRNDLNMTNQALKVNNQELTDELNSVKQTLSDKESNFQDLSDKLRSVSETLSDKESSYQVLKIELDSTIQSLSDKENDLRSRDSYIREIEFRFNQDTAAYKQGIQHMESQLAEERQKGIRIW